MYADEPNFGVWARASTVSLVCFFFSFCTFALPMKCLFLISDFISFFSLGRWREECFFISLRIRLPRLIVFRVGIFFARFFSIHFECDNAPEACIHVSFLACFFCVCGKWTVNRSIRAQVQVDYAHFPPQIALIPKTKRVHQSSLFIGE